MDEEKETRKKLILINETLKKRNEIMDADLQTFKEQHLTANNKVLIDFFHYIFDDSEMLIMCCK